MIGLKHLRSISAGWWLRQTKEEIVDLDKSASFGSSHPRHSNGDVWHRLDTLSGKTSRSAASEVVWPIVRTPLPRLVRYYGCTNYVNAGMP
jgi:hypothetical protein